MNGELRVIPAELMDRLDDEDVVQQIMASDGLSVGKAWNGLHFLYCGDGVAGESAISGGEPLFAIDNGYGPPQFLTPDEVVVYAEQLEAMTDDDLRDAYDPKAMREDNVYGIDFDNPRELEWLIEEARKVRAFYKDAAAKGRGILQFLA
jgi:hypothetical protein